ncbi:MAG: nucleotidyltransferase family protein [Pseudomonadales bacterium]|nr:nucleotidyltransferase family protein [Pseudomonadales bacterium]
MSKGALILAAGFSTRYDGSKLAAILDNGSTVLQQTLQRISAATPNMVIITRNELIEQGVLDTGICQLDTLRRHAFTREHATATADSSLQIFSCPDAHLGMGHTLSFGIQQVSHWEACLVCLADMPFIRTSSYQQLLAQLRPDNIVIPQYQQEQGNPVGFGRQFFPQLARLQGDSGGRKLLRQARQHITLVSLNDSAILQDIDTPEDLQRYQ